jgi:hypothetical protein
MICIISVNQKKVKRDFLLIREIANQRAYRDLALRERDAALARNRAI